MGELLLKYAEAQEAQKKDREPPASMVISSKLDAIQKGTVVDMVEAQDPPVSNKPAQTRGTKRNRYAIFAS